MLRAILVSALWLNLGLLLGRLSGFAREALVAANFGLSAEADVVVLMLTIPDLLVSLLMGGAMGAVLVPVLSQAGDHARRILFQASLVFGSAFALITLLLVWQTEALVAILVPGFGDLQRIDAARAITPVLWLIPLTVLAGTTTAFLHSANRFAITSMGTLFLNGAVICGLALIYHGYTDVGTLAMFVLLGGVLRYLSQLLPIQPRFDLRDSLRPFYLSRELFLRYAQAISSGSLLFMFPVIARAYASFGDSGSVALLNYTVRLVELPLAVCISFLAVVLFPRLSQTYESDPQLHQRLIAYGSQITLVLALLVAILLVWLSPEYAALVYGYGDMGSEQVEQVAALLGVGLLVLPLQGLAVYNTAIFNSRRDTRTPMLINAAGLMAYVILLQGGFADTGLASILWALIMSFALVVVLQWTFLLRGGVDMASIYLRPELVIGIVITSSICFALGRMIAATPYAPISKLALAMVCGCGCLLLVAAFFPEVRARIGRTGEPEK